jgi:hypothetical protein
MADTAVRHLEIVSGQAVSSMHCLTTDTSSEHPRDVVRGRPNDGWLDRTRIWTCGGDSGMLHDEYVVAASVAAPILITEEVRRCHVDGGQVAARWSPPLSPPWSAC